MHYSCIALPEARNFEEVELSASLSEAKEKSDQTT